MSDSPTKGKGWLRRAAASLGLAGWFYAGQLGSWTSEQNRYHAFWDTSDALALAAGVLGCAAAVFLGSLLVDAWGGPRLRRAARFLFLLVLAVSVVSWGISTFVGVGFTSKYDWVFWLGWGAIAAGLFALYAQLWKPAATFAAVMSPLPLILLVQVFSWPGWSPETGDATRPLPSGMTPTAATANADTANTADNMPVYIFVFDEWSYPRSISGGQFQPEFVNLRRLSDRSTNYHQARSPGDATLVSLPRLLFMRHQGALSPRNGELLWQEGGTVRPVRELATLFDEPLARGAHARLIGFYHPYPRLLAGREVECLALPNDPKAAGLGARAGEHLLYNLRFMTDPVSRAVYRHLHTANFIRHWSQLQKTIRDRTFDLLASGDPRTFALIHWPLPHGPFVFDADGSFRGPPARPDDVMYGTADAYHRHLLLLDRTVGEIVDLLAETGQLEASLLILTSDHGWRREPDPQIRAAAPDVQHVPLLVKFPYQARRQDRTAPFRTADLAALIEEAQTRFAAGQATASATGHHGEEVADHGDRGRADEHDEDARENEHH